MRLEFRQTKKGFSIYRCCGEDKTGRKIGEAVYSSKSGWRIKELITFSEEEKETAAEWIKMRSIEEAEEAKGFELALAKEKGRGEASAPELLIIAEGRSEVVYFTEWAKALKITGKVKIRQGFNPQPIQLLEEAVSSTAWIKGKTGKYPETWIVFDRDKHFDYDETLETAKAYPHIHCAWTNPCLEFWFLLHFEPAPCGLAPSIKLSESKTVTTKEIDPTHTLRQETTYTVWGYSPQEAAERLKAHLGKYKKAEGGIFGTLKPFYFTALKNAEGLDNPETPGTNIPALIKALEKLNPERAELMQKRFRSWALEEERNPQQAPRPLDPHANTMLSGILSEKELGEAQSLGKEALTVLCALHPSAYIGFEKPMRSLTGRVKVGLGHIDRAFGMKEKYGRPSDPNFLKGKIMKAANAAANVLRALPEDARKLALELSDSPQAQSALLKAKLLIEQTLEALKVRKKS